ncbi:MAG: hypothetical protein CL912_01415 [Deltaproteobacteria bacterium]|nr:hypothetical protein [Deltaproteobacteria bacterium]
MQRCKASARQKIGWDSVPVSGRERGVEGRQEYWLMDTCRKGANKCTPSVCSFGPAMAQYEA